MLSGKLDPQEVSWQHYMCDRYCVPGEYLSGRVCFVGASSSHVFAFELRSWNRGKRAGKPDKQVSHQGLSEPFQKVGVAPESVGMGRAFVNLPGWSVSANGQHTFVLSVFDFFSQLCRY